MKKVYCYAYHDFIHSEFYFNDFSEIPNNFIDLLKRQQKNIYAFSSIKPDCLINPIQNFNQYACLGFKKNKTYDAFSLTNTEVSFKYSTGSFNVMRFETLEDARLYYIYM